MTDLVGSNDLRAIDRAHPEDESIERRLSTAAAETATGVTGVHRLGGAAARTLDRASRAVLGTSTSPGVSVARIDGALIIDIDLVSEYPQPVTALIERVREQVRRAAAQLSSERVVVNVAVTDVHGPFDPIEVPDSERAEGGPSLVEKAGNAVDSAREKTGDALDSAREKTADAVDSARAKLETAREASADALDTAREKTGAAIDDARRKTADAVDALDEAADRAADSDATADALSDGIATTPAASVDASTASAEAATASVDAPVAEFVVRVEVEPVDGSTSAAGRAVVEIEPVEIEPVESADTAPETSSDARRGSE